MDILADRLYTLRHERGLSQASVAKELGVSPFTYQRYEYGDREPQATALKHIADFYGVSADYLLGRTDQRL